MKIGYLRTSTEEQSQARQIDGLREICDELHIESGVSAVGRKRPVYAAVRDKLRAGDTFVVWDLDRAFRSTVDALLELEDMKRRGVHLRIVTLAIDTATPAGMLVYTVMAALGQWERDNLRQRTREGMAAAKRRGKTAGRPRKLTNPQLEVAKRMLAEEARSLAQVAALFNVGKSTLHKALSRFERERHPTEDASIWLHGKRSQSNGR